jgi:hypothetical protein
VESLLLKALELGFFFFYTDGIVHQEEFIPYATQMFFGIYGEMGSKNFLRNGTLETGLPAMTVLLLSRNDMTLGSQPSYSPDLALCDVFLFPKLKLVFIRKILDDVITIKEK